MRHLSFTSLLVLCLSTSLFCQVVDFEDIAFKNYLISLGVDTNTDGEIQNSEAEAVNELLIEGSNASSIVGIKAFTNLISLSCADEFQNIDVSEMPNLATLRIDGSVMFAKLNAHNCPELETVSSYSSTYYADSINLSSCPGITSIVIDGNFSGSNLDFSNCEGLRSYTQFVDGDTYLLDLSGCTLLQTADLNGIFLGDLNFSNLPNLRDLKLFGSYFGVTCNMLPSLQSINASGQLGPRFVIKECPLLNDLTFETGEINGLNFDNLPSLKDAKITATLNNQNLSMINCASLETANLNIDQADTIDVSGCTKLQTLSGTSPSINNVIARECNSLIEFSLEPLLLLDLSGAVKLRELNIFTSPKRIFLNRCYDLETFYCDEGSTEVLDFSSCFNLMEAVIGARVSALIISNTSNETLYLPNTQNLRNICCDPDEIQYVESLFTEEELQNITIGADCPAFNAGAPFLINGNAYLNTNNDDCTSSETKLSLVKFSLFKNGELNRYFYTNNDGSYKLYSNEGNYTICLSPLNSQTRLQNINL